MTYRKGAVTVPVPNFADPDVQAWAVLLRDCLLSWRKEMDALITETRKAAADAIADLSSSTDPADTPADADTLRDDLVTNHIAAHRTAINSILAALRTNGIVEE